MTFRAVWLPTCGLWAVVVAQPLLWALAGAPGFFVAHRAGPAELVSLAVAVTWLPPTLLAATVWLAGRLRPRAGERLMAAVAAVHAASFAAYACGQFGVSSGWMALPGAAAGAGGAWIAWNRSAAARGFASALGAASVAVPVLFLARPSLRPVLAGDGTAFARSAADAPAAAPIPVVLLVIDELPLVSLFDADRAIDPVLYPHLASLAREGTWFRNATTVSDYTEWAVPAILSGRYPRPGALATASDYPDSVFTMLAPTHHVEAVEAITHVCPNAICRDDPEPLAGRLQAMVADLRVVAGHVLLPKDVAARLLPPLTGDWAGFEKEKRGGARVRRDRREIALSFLAWIDRTDPQPAFYYLHTLLPHTPHERLPSGQRNVTRAPVPGDDKWTWTSDAWGVAQHYQRHLLQIGFVDTLVGLLVERLKSQGLYDRSLVIVVADHGIAFRPGVKRRSFTSATAGDIMRVPLIVKLPAGRAWPAGLGVEMVHGQRVSDRNVETIDIVPTIADVLRLPMPWASGTSLLDTSIERPGKRILIESARRRRNYPREGPDVSESIARKIALFGARGNPYRIPRPARFADLVGRPLAACRVTGGGGRVTLESRELFDRFDHRAAEVPFDLAGSLARPGGAPVFVAVAVNGTIRAVTATWPSDPGRFLATPPLDVWLDGANTIDVFVVEGDERDPVLRRTEGAS